jgi:aldehyde dehydrogenase (NAD+)
MISSVLKELGISEKHQGNSTGNNWFGSGQTFDSYSPVDGEKIGTTSSLNIEEYENCIQQAEKAFVQFQHLNEEKWFVNWAMPCAKKRVH